MSAPRLDAARWDRIQALFHDTADLPIAERDAFLDAATVDDATIAAHVRELLAADDAMASVLDRPLGHVASDVLDEPASLPPGREFGPYRIVRLLGEGGMGVVYLAERADLGSTVAIKLLRDPWLSPARRERFTAEQRMLAQLNHPSIARLYDAGTFGDGTPWIAMEYVDGVPLGEFCRAHDCSLSERLRLFRAVCDAVQHAHQHLVIHRDLKPSNILVTPDGGVKLLDFGIAKQLEPDVAGDATTRTGLRLMTPAYAAPEQLRGAAIGVQTDVYTLGVVLYELLAGRLPFDVANRTPGEAEAMILTDAPTRPSIAARAETPGPTAVQPVRGVSESTWADLDVLCLTAMHKDTQRRYASVEALARDVDHFTAREPLEARADSFGYRFGKFTRRHRASLALAATVFAVVVGLIAFYTVRLSRARDAAVAEAARTRRIQGFMTKLFEGGDAAEGTADSLRVVTLLEQGAQNAATLHAEPAVQAELYQTLGEAFDKLGQFDRADTLLRASLDKRRALYGAEHADVAASLVALGTLRKDQGQFVEAEKLVREGLAMNVRLFGPTHPNVANATTALGIALQAGGRFDEAIRVLDDAVRLQSISDSSASGLATSLTALGIAHFDAGHFAAAESLDVRATVIDRKLYGPRHPEVGTDLMNLGSVQYQRGDYQAAEKNYREGVAIFEQWYGPQHPHTAGALTILAGALIKLSRYDEAVSMLQRALVVQERVYGELHPRVAYVLNSLGAAEAELKRPEDAERYYMRSEDILRRVYGDAYYLVAAAKSNRAAASIMRGDYGKAESLLRTALASYATSLPPEHLYVGTARLRLGRALAKQKRWPEAERELLAGYTIVAKQSVPTSPTLVAARQDLAAAYDALGRADEAAKYRE